jgi:hypothetical protein
MTTETQPQIDVGTIFYSSWGYDQTNVDFYTVTKRTATAVTLQQVKTIAVESGDMQGKVIAGTEPVGKPIRRKLIHGDQVRIETYAGAWVWDGRPKGCTSYA